MVAAGGQHRDNKNMNETTPGAGFSAAPPAQSQQRALIPFEFHGSGSEYFRIWIVNLLLTIVTLGIYSAWAKVRRLRYFYGNTYLDGHSFEYHGLPMQILKGRLIVAAFYVVFVIFNNVAPILSVVLLLPLIFFGMPWIIVRARMFQMRMSSYRNIRFGFHGTYGGALGAFIGWYFLAIITLGILFPMWTRKRVAYTLENVSFGNERFRFTTGVGTFYKFCLITFVLAVIGYAAFAACMGALTSVMQVMRESAGGIPPTSEELLAAFGVTGVVVVLGFIVLALAITGYYQASFTNASFGGIEVGRNFIRSNLKAGPLVMIHVTNFIGILCTLGLFYPWAKVRLARYQLENMAFDAVGSPADFTAAAGANMSAVGEEAGDLLDVDFGL
jgi:uncharacterized membrane protein YjgN (DUF898 family)